MFSRNVKLGSKRLSNSTFCPYLEKRGKGKNPLCVNILDLVCVVERILTRNVLSETNVEVN